MLVLVPGCSGDDQAAYPVEPGNIVIIIADALRFDVLGCYGGDVRTPNIDWLAEQGVLFENAYCNSPWTTPSGATILTGNYASTYPHSSIGPTIDLHVPLSELTFGEVLEELGYSTMAGVENLHARTFNVFQGFRFLPTGRSLNRRTSAPLRAELARAIGTELDGPETYQSLYLALATVLQTPPTQRFCLLYWFLDPHEPYDPIDRFRAGVKTDPSELPRELAYYTSRTGRLDDMSEFERQYMWELYKAEVESIDERVGFILDTLRRSNQLENTTIVFTTDHGEQFGEHGEWGHGAWGKDCHYFDSLVKIPLVVSGPGLPGGERRRSPVSLVDLMPTLKDLFGIDYPSTMQGRSFAPLLFRDDEHHRPVYFTDIRKHDHVDALREGGFKLIAVGQDEVELYDLSSDPNETTNVAGDHPDLARRLHERIKAQRQENAERKAMNTAEEGDSTFVRSDEELRKRIKALKALGYVK
jgi:arylsulfatase A-like enzyme